MKKETLEILGNNNTAIEDFIENLCVENHIHNYLGSISVALYTALHLTRGRIVLFFQKCTQGVQFGIQAEQDFFSILTKEFSKESETLFLINNLADQISVHEAGKVLEMTFYVNGIDTELAFRREESLRGFSLLKNKTLCHK